MKRKIKSVKGFTLAELLIVVAIIAVLVAIGIPIFTSQLEKSREAVDLSDVRSAYAEVMMAAITGDTTAIYTKDANQTIYKQEDNIYSITVKPLKQKQDGWQTALPITIGGVSSTDNVHWVGTPGANGECVITYIPPVGASDEAVKFEWKGGTSEDNGGTGGNGGGVSGGNSGNSGETNNSGPGAGNTNNIMTNLNMDAIEYPEQPKQDENKPFAIEMGVAYKKKGTLYIAITNANYTNNYDYKAPDNDSGRSYFVQPTGTILTKDNLKNPWNNNLFVIEDVKQGDIYKDGTDYYICKTNCSYYNPPGNGNIDTEGTGGGNWIKINMKNLTAYQ